MFKIMILIGIILLLISIAMILIIPRNQLTNGVDMPKIAEVGIILLIISVITLIIGAIGSSPIIKALIS